MGDDHAGLQDHHYLGQTMRTFKERLGNHKQSYKKASHRKDTSLSEFIWDLKQKGKQWSITYEKVKECKLYQRESGVCQLCQEEKMEIFKLLQNQPNTTINKRTELLRHCLHSKNDLLCNYRPALSFPSIGPHHNQVERAEIQPQINTQKGQNQEVLVEEHQCQTSNHQETVRKETIDEVESNHLADLSGRMMTRRQKALKAIQLEKEMENIDPG